LASIGICCTVPTVEGDAATVRPAVGPRDCSEVRLEKIPQPCEFDYVFGR